MPDQTTRNLGIVSNCWKTQLDRGETLESLIGRAQHEGFRAVELRQGCLAEYETAAAEAQSSKVACDQLAGLSRRHPAIHLNLAVSLPFFGGSLAEDDPRILHAVAAAQELARDGKPHLRVVDAETRTRSPDEASITHAVALLRALTMKLVSAGGMLSIEHGHQNWPVFWSTLSQVRRELGSEASQLRVCLDPCNLLMTEPPESIARIVASRNPADVAMIHLKQRRDGQIQPDVADGDLDWRELRMLLQNHHSSPWLYEVAPHPNVWMNLKRSTEFLFPDRP